MAEIVVLNGVRAGAVFELPDVPTVIGRSPEAHFQLDDPWISSMHAMFERRGSELWVVDLESRNGTFVGDTRVQEAALAQGAVLRFGRTEVRLERRASRRLARHPTPASIAAPPGLLRQDATSPMGFPTVHRGEVGGLSAEAAALATRTVALLRVVLHLPAQAQNPDAEAIRIALDGMARATRAQRGILIRQGGTGVLAVFGLAQPSPDDAEAALRAARATRAVVRGLDAGLDVRIAVDRGPVLVGNVSGPEGFELAALGEVAERLERVLALAGPGTILVGPGAVDAAGLEPSGTVQAGGEELAVARLAG